MTLRQAVVLTGCSDRASEPDSRPVWPDLASSPAASRLEDICFASTTDGRAVGQGGSVMHTRTGGL